MHVRVAEETAKRIGRAYHAPGLTDLCRVEQNGAVVTVHHVPVDGINARLTTMRNLIKSAQIAVGATGVVFSEARSAPYSHEVTITRKMPLGRAAPVPRKEARALNVVRLTFTFKNRTG
jgi:hypothetical protein